MEVFADPLIVKVFFNLIDNALRHGGRITTIRFAFEARNGDRIIICEDDGDGVARGEKERIFERGFGKNTGFGLAISREILDITGITIRETGEPGRGARFEIRVPKGAYRLAGEGKTPSLRYLLTSPFFVGLTGAPFPSGTSMRGECQYPGDPSPPQTGRDPFLSRVISHEMPGGRCRMTLPGPGWGKPGTVPAIL